MKVQGSYQSVVLGVSQQVPHERRSGQMWEQVNMVSDPVRGVARRWGSVFLDARTVRDTEMSEADMQTAVNLYREAEYTCDGRDLVVLYAKGDTVPYGLPPVMAYDITQKKVLGVRGDGQLWDLLKTNGASSRVNIGRFLYLSVNNHKTTFTVQNRIKNMLDPKAGVLWIRQGNFSKKYEVTIVKPDGTSEVFEYTTPPASYPGKLDTSDIPIPDVPTNPGTDDGWSPSNTLLQQYQKDLAEYNKLISDRTNAYNSAVTNWIGEATAQMQPAYIAQQLAEKITAAGHAEVQHVGAYVAWSAASNIADAVPSENSDGTFMRAVAYQVDAVESLTPKHWVGHIVKVAAKKQDQKDAYYMEAFRKTEDGETFTDVIWRETAGQRTVPDSMFLHCWADMNTLYVASSPEGLNALAPDADAPGYESSSVGDALSSPAPGFFGKPINYMGVFQDRLLISAGAAVFASRPGDYLNWFRKTVLDILDNDPMEMYALGSEDDTISWDTTFDRNLVLFGRKNQYIIPGRQTMSPKSPYIQIMSSIKDTVLAEPKASGSYVFYGKDTSVKGSVHQIQIGAVSDSSDSYEISQALDNYLKGRPVQLVTIQSPNNVVIRTTDYHYGLYIYTYLQNMNGGERVFDSWSRWEWPKALGMCVGMCDDDGTLLVFKLRNNNGATTLQAERFSFETELPDTGYLDCNRPMDLAVPMEAGRAAHYVGGHPYYLLGSRLDKIDANMSWWKEDVEHLRTGFITDAYVVPTSPYMRDRNDNPITTGRLTLGSFKVNVEQTAGLYGQVTTADRTYDMVDYGGRLLTRKSNQVGRVPLVDTSLSVPVYREIREFQLRLQARDWLPLTITGLEWVGQWFNRTQRV